MGGRLAGNAVPAKNGVIVAEVFGSTAIRHPTDAAPAPLVAILTKDGAFHSAIGRTDTVGRYLPAYRAHVTARVVDDSIVLVRHHDAAIVRIALSDAVRGVDALRWQRLPAFLGERDEWEEWWSPSWIQRGGELFQVFGVPEVEAVTTGPAGHLYLVRNVHAKWFTGRNRFLKTQGMWRVRDRALEVRATNGDLKSTFRLPADGGRWIRVDDLGRIILPIDSGAVGVFAAAGEQKRRCGNRGRLRSIKIEYRR